MDLDDFPLTQWTQVLEATSRDPERARQAVVALCVRYRDAIRSWFQRDLRTRQEAEDLTHDFLSRWLARDAPLGNFTRGERRFREFLAVCLRHFAASRHEQAVALKRGGGAVHLDLTEEAAAPEAMADALDLDLARRLHQTTLAELAGRWHPRVPRDGWPRLCDLAWGGDPAPHYAAQAADLGVPMGTLKGWIFRIRQEHYEGFRQRARMLTDPDDVDAEVRHLLGLLFRHGLEDGTASSPARTLVAPSSHVV